MNFFKNTFNTFFSKKQTQKQSQSTNKLNQEQPDQELVKIFDIVSKLISSSQTPMDDQLKLKLYGLYKQATIGVCNIKKPVVYQFVAKAKWEAWNNLQNMSKVEAMKNYIILASKMDPTIPKKLQQQLGEQFQQQHSHQHCENHENHEYRDVSGLKIVQQKDYSDTYSHPYFKAIQKGDNINQISHQKLLEINNNPKVYPLHFAIDKERQDIVPLFLNLLTVEQINQMKDEQGTGILQYAQLIQNQVILKLVRQKLAL